MDTDTEIRSDYWVITPKGCFMHTLTRKEAAEIKADGTPIGEAEPDEIGILAGISRRVIGSLFNQAHQLSRQK